MLRKKRAFTMIELLVVIAIIGILATIMIVAYTNAQAKARDNKRKADILAISSALEMKYADTKSYSSTVSAQVFYSYVNTGPSYDWAGLNGLLGDYINPIPQDPKVVLSAYRGAASWNLGTLPPVGSLYAYGVAVWPDKYCLTARLELGSGNTADYITPNGVCGGFNKGVPRPNDFVYDPLDQTNNTAYFVDKH